MKDRRDESDEMRTLVTALLAQQQVTEDGARRILEVWDAQSTGTLRHPGWMTEERAFRAWAAQQGQVPGPGSIL